MKHKAKILLFGEYLVLHDSDALLIPLSTFSGELAFIDTIQKGINGNSYSNNIIANLYNYIIKEYRPESITDWLDLTSLKHDIDAGLYFKSIIPVGYGVGSSGALTAALFGKYTKHSHEYWKNNLLALKNNLSMLESYFHGKSSGLDPLLSYLDRGIFLQKGKISPDDSNYSIFNPFLIDTKKSRQTEDLVNLFHEKCLSTEYFNVIRTKLIKTNNQCIRSFQEGNQDAFFKELKKLSALQLEHFREMILPEYEPLWIHGLEKGEFYLKLCGAGGGGYVLGFAINRQAILKLKNEYRFEITEL